MTTPSCSIQRSVATLILSAVCGALAGAAAGFVTAGYQPAVEIPTTRVVATSTASVPVTPSTTLALMPLEQRAVARLLLPAFAKHGTTAVASVFRKQKGVVLEDRLLTDDRLLGQAVALTSDGWFVTSAEVVEGVRTADLTLWVNGASYSVERGVMDHLNGTVFLKVSATNLQPSAFAHVQDIQPGAEVWTETRPGELAPSIVLSVSARTNTDPVLSESVSRRIVLGGTALAGDRGGAAWDPNGSLIGLVESGVGERVKLVPGSTIATSFASLLANGEIRHAQLGVRAVDIATLKIDGSRDALPATGALIRDDRKTGKPGIVRDLPASKTTLKTGDVILRVDRDILDGGADLGEILSEYRPGTVVTLRVLHGTTDADVPVTLGQMVTSEALK